MSEKNIRRKLYSNSIEQNTMSQEEETKSSAKRKRSEQEDEKQSELIVDPSTILEVVIRLPIEDTPSEDKEILLASTKAELPTTDQTKEEEDRQVTDTSAGGEDEEKSAKRRKIFCGCKTSSCMTGHMGQTERRDFYKSLTVGVVGGVEYEQSSEKRRAVETDLEDPSSDVYNFWNVFLVTEVDIEDFRKRCALISEQSDNTITVWGRQDPTTVFVHVQNKKSIQHIDLVRLSGIEEKHSSTEYSFENKEKHAIVQDEASKLYRLSPESTVYMVVRVYPLELIEYPREACSTKVTWWDGGSKPEF